MADQVHDQSAVALAAPPRPIVNPQPITCPVLGWFLAEQAQQRRAPAGHAERPGQASTRLAGQHHRNAMQASPQPVRAMRPTLSQRREVFGKGAPWTAGLSTSKPPNL
jgi:hypothetical protein